MVHIVSIDDRKENLELLNILLRRRIPNSKVVDFLSGVDAIPYIENEQPDIILLDILLPVKNGYEICKELKDNPFTTHIPIILITAIYRDSASIIKGLDLGADAFISKPINEGELVAQVKTMLRTKKAEDKLREEKLQLDEIVKERTKELYTSQERLKQAELMAKLGHFQFNLATDSMIWSDEFFRIFSLDASTLPDSKIIQDMIHPDDLEMATNAFFNSLGSNENFHTQVRIIDKQSNIKYLECILSFERDWEGKIRKVFGTISDVTERRKAEQALFESNNRYKKLNETKDRLFSIIAHDLKNPFMSIQGFAELVQKKIDKLEKEKIVEFMNLVREQTKQAHLLLENLLDWAMSQTGDVAYNPEDIDLHEIIENTKAFLNLTLNNKNIQVDVNLHEPISIFADEKMISTVLRNLMSNAVKFSNRGSTIFIECEKDDVFAKISVKDQGIGIHPDIKEQLFAIDKRIKTEGTEKEKGTGLGLTLCNDFIEKHGGCISVESEMGKGSKFYFTVPLSKK